MKIITLSGSSGCGKDTVQSILEKQLGFKPMVSCTTRKRRSNEIEGVNYFFIKESVFQQLLKDGDLLEHRVYKTIENGVETTWHYGLERSELKEGINIVVVDMVGLRELKEQFGNDLISILIKAPLEDRRIRAIARDKNYEEAEFERRAIDDDNVFKNAESEVDFYTHNIDLYECVNSIKGFLSEKGVI